MRDFLFRFFLFCWLALFGVGSLTASYVSGDPGANPDAKAELKGLAYIPPEQENFGYDADGNRISSALWTYNWDGRNRLVGARSKDYLTAPKGFDLTFNYDAEGRRFQKNVTEYNNGSITATRNTIFVWDGWDLLYERCEDAGGALLLERKYVWGESPVGAATGNLLCIRETKNGVTSELLPLYDGSGHLTALTDSNKNLLAEYAYGPFGELIHAKGPRADANPWRYATKYFDQETGLYYFGHRYYDPNSGQWMNREPLGENESLNLYAYCHNDSVNKVDVLGLKSVLVDNRELLKFLQTLHSTNPAAARELLALHHLTDAAASVGGRGMAPASNVYQFAANLRGMIGGIKSDLLLESWRGGEDFRSDYNLVTAGTTTGLLIGEYT